MWLKQASVKKKTLLLSFQRATLNTLDIAKVVKPVFLFKRSIELEPFIDIKQSKHMSFFCQYQKVVSYIWRVSEDEDTVNDEEDDDEDSSDLRRNTSNS